MAVSYGRPAAGRLEKPFAPGISYCLKRWSGASVWAFDSSSLRAGFNRHCDLPFPGPRIERALSAIDKHTASDQLFARRSYPFKRHCHRFLRRHQRRTKAAARKALVRRCRPPIFARRISGKGAHQGTAGE